MNNNNHLEIISFINSKMALNVKPKSIFNKMNYNQTSVQPVLYSQILITRTITISINNIGNSIKETLEKAIAAQIEGKCIVEGYIKPKTVEIITFSSGLVAGSYVVFEVVFQCYVCSPVEGMLINCSAKHINKAGIRAEVNELPSPVVIFIARDHNYASALFAQVKENDEIKVRVIGQRFELNDKYISIIAELIETKQVQAQGQAKQAQGQAKQAQFKAKPNTTLKRNKLVLKAKTRPAVVVGEGAEEGAEETAKEIEAAVVEGEAKEIEAKEIEAKEIEAKEIEAKEAEEEATVAIAPIAVTKKTNKLKLKIK